MRAGCDSPRVFTVEERDRVRRRLLEIADTDARIVAGAEIGALATGGDRWSDLDLTFGVADGASVDAVLADWTTAVTDEFAAAHLFDLPFQTTIYRVFLLPGNLQVDLSFTPESAFGARGPKFKLLFGTTVERDPVPPASAQHLFGLGVHHAVRARICIERGRFWQAEYWISALRDEALALACRRRELEGSYGRGFDELPAATLALASTALVGSLEQKDLVRALRDAVDLLLQEADEVREIASELTVQLRELTT
jgi:hypothetical protein